MGDNFGDIGAFGASDSFGEVGDTLRQTGCALCGEGEDCPGDNSDSSGADPGIDSGADSGAVRRLRPEPLRLTGPDGELDAYALFKRLAQINVLCRRFGFQCVQVSDLDGFGDHLEGMQQAKPLLAVSDTSAGSVSTVGTQLTRRIKTVFLFMPHSVQSRVAERRAECFRVMREIMRQMLSVLIRQSARLRLSGISVDPTVTFEEIGQYFFSGGACGYFSIVTDRTTDLRLRDSDWTEDPMGELTL